MSVALKRRKRAVASVANARPAPMPGFVAPCDPTLRDNPPPAGDWLYEIKADGYRAQLHLGAGAVTIYSRTGVNWTKPFAGIAQAAKHLTAGSAIFDGEAVVYGATGRPDFQALRRELG